MQRVYGVDLPEQPGDLATIATPLDFLGANYYSPAVIADDPDIPDVGKEPEELFYGVESGHEYKEWKEQWKDYNKKLLDAADRLSSVSRSLLHRPLFPFAEDLLPTTTILKPFNIPEDRWFEGTWIVAAQGRGKTNLLRHLILNKIADATIIILDAKGDLLRSFQRLGTIEDRLVIIEPDLENPPAINPLDMGRNAVEFLSYLFELLDTKMTPNQTTLFRLVLTLLEKVPNATLETFRDIIQNGWKHYAQYVEQLKPRDRDFFEKEFNTKTYSDRKPEVLLRLRLLLSNPYLEAMLLAPKTKLDIGPINGRREGHLYQQLL